LRIIVIDGRKCNENALAGDQNPWIKAGFPPKKGNGITAVIILPAAID
jgi:hypothetical protein